MSAKENLESLGVTYDIAVFLDWMSHFIGHVNAFRSASLGPVTMEAFVGACKRDGRRYYNTHTAIKAAGRG